MRITWFLMLGILVAIVLSILLIDDGRMPMPQAGLSGPSEPQPNPLAPPPTGQP